MSLTKDTLLFGLIDFFFRILAFFTFPFFLHILSPGQFGLLALVITLPNLFVVLFVWIHQALPRFYWDREEGDRPALISTALLLNIGSAIAISALLLSFLYPVRGWLFDASQIEWSWWLLIIAGQIPLQIFYFAVIVHRLHFSRKGYLSITALYQIALIALTLWFGVGMEKGVEGYVVGAALAALLVAPIALWSIWRWFAWTLSWRDAKLFWGFGLPFLFSTLAYWLFSSIDRWMLGSLGDLEQVGLYSIAFKFARMVILAVLAFGQAWNPHAMRARSERLDYCVYYGRTLTQWSSILLLLGAAVSLFSREALFLIAPQSYWGASSLVPPLIAGVILYGTTQVTGTGLSIAKQTRLFALGSWGAAALNVALNLWLIPLYGAHGAAWATLASYGLLATLYLYWSDRHHPIPLDRGGLLTLLGLLAISTIGALYLCGIPWGPWQVVLKCGWLAIVGTNTVGSIARRAQATT